jgi:hypothetical protein
MQFEHEYEIVINLSRFQVVEYFVNPHILKKWYLQGEYELIEGKLGQPGAVTRIRNTITSSGPWGTSRTTTEHIHTVIKNDLPYEYVSTLEGKFVKTTSYSIFQEEASNVTRWINRNVTELSGVAKVMGLLTKKAVRTTARSMMKGFKKHAESFYIRQMVAESQLVR